jgi:hypothetical protein
MISPLHFYDHEMPVMRFRDHEMPTTRRWRRPMNRFARMLLLCAAMSAAAESAQAIDGYLAVPGPRWQYHRGGPTGYGKIGFSAYRGMGYGYRGYPRCQYRAYDPRYGYPGSWVGQGNGYPYYTYWGWGYPGFGGSPNVGGSIR